MSTRLLKLAKNATLDNSCLAGNIGFLTAKCIALMENQLEFTSEDQKKLLQDCLEGDCEYPLEVIAEMTDSSPENQ